MICDEEIVNERLNIGKDQPNRILVGKGWQMQMYLLFKKAFEPIKEPHKIVDTSKDIVPYIQRIVRERFIGNT